MTDKSVLPVYVKPINDSTVEWQHIGHNGGLAPTPPATGNRCWAMADDDNPDVPIGSARCVLPTDHTDDHIWEPRP